MRVTILCVALAAPLSAWAGEISTPVQLSAAGQSAAGVEMAATADGTVYVIWAEKGPPQPGRGHFSEDDLFLARWPAGESRPAAVTRVNARPGAAKSSAVSRARVTVDETGLVHLLYPANALSPVTGKPVIDVHYARSLDGGRSFTTPVALNSPATNDLTASSHSTIAAAATFVALAAAPGGGVYAFWLDSRHSAHAESPSSIYAARSTDRGATWSADSEVFNMACECCQPVATAGDGALLLTSRSVSVDGFRDPLVTRVGPDLTAQPGAARLGEARWAIDGCPMKATAIAAAGRRAWVAWYSHADAPAGVWFASSGDGGRSFGDGRPLHPAAEVSDAPALAVAGERVIVAWHAKAGGNRRIFASVSEDGGRTFTAPQALSPEAEAAGYPAVVLSGAGALVAWQQGPAVFAARIALGERRQ